MQNYLQPVNVEGFNVDYIKLDKKGNLPEPKEKANAGLKEVADAVMARN